MKRSSQNQKGGKTTPTTDIVLAWVLSTAGDYCLQEVTFATSDWHIYWHIRYATKN